MNNCAYWPEGKPLDLFATTKRMVECMCICVCAWLPTWVYVHPVPAGIYRDQKRALDHLELVTGS